jgi:hypothetical protein
VPVSGRASTGACCTSFCTDRGGAHGS